MTKSLRTLICAGLLFAAQPAIAAEFYVSPAGNPQGPGTRKAPYDIATVLSGKSPVGAGDTVWLLGGLYSAPPDPEGKFTFQSVLSGAPEKPIIVRQVAGERATIQGALVINGSNVWYWGFEVRGMRGMSQEGDSEASINVFGSRTRFINLIVHRGAAGYGFWTPAVDAEIYGNLVFDFGYGARDRGHGHGCYSQNDKGTKHIVDNMMFGGYGWNLHCYAENGQIRGYHIEGNFFFCSGMDSPPSDDAKDNILVGGKPPADKYVLIHNIAYHPRTGGRPNVRLGTYGKGPNGEAEIRDNYFMGLDGVLLDRWLKMTFTGNEVWASGSILTASRGQGAKEEDWLVNKNTYYAMPWDAKFNDTFFFAFRLKTGWDKESKLVAPVNGKPHGTRVFVRPNRYEPGRAHVAVFNWDKKDRVEIELSSSGLKIGQKFQVRNVQDLYGEPAYEGVFNGKSVSFPMLKSAIAPQFDAFLVIPEESFGSFLGRTDDPRPDWLRWDWKLD